MKNSKKPKSYTINIENLIQEFSICTCNLKEDAGKIKKEITKILSSACKEEPISAEEKIKNAITKAVNDATLIVD